MVTPHPTETLTEVLTTYGMNNFTSITTVIWENISSSTVLQTPSEELLVRNFGGVFDPPLTVKAWLVPLILGVITLMGIIGNIVVIFVIFKNGKMHTVTNFYIVNLAATDIAFLFFVVPPTASTYATPINSWIWGRFMCKFVNYMQLVTAQATCLTLTAMSVDRYQAIVHPLKSLRTRTTKVAAIISITIWSFSLIASIPFAVYWEQFSYGSFSFCLETWPARVRQFMRKAVVTYPFIVIYVIPLLIICVCYAKMLGKLWTQVVPAAARSAQAQERQTRQKRKITYMVLVVVVVFMLCWLPFHIVALWIRIGENYPKTMVADIFQVFARILAYTNSCLNPFVYAFMGENFRTYFKKAFPCCYSNKVGPQLPMESRRDQTNGVNKENDNSNVPP